MMMIGESTIGFGEIEVYSTLIQTYLYVATERTLWLQLNEIYKIFCIFNCWHNTIMFRSCWKKRKKNTIIAGGLFWSRFTSTFNLISSTTAAAAADVFVVAFLVVKFYWDLISCHIFLVECLKSESAITWNIWNDSFRVCVCLFLRSFNFSSLAK